MTSDISFMGALWDSSGDVYNGGFFRIWFCISWQNVIGNWAIFRNPNLLIYLLSEFLFADVEATYGMRCASYHTEKSMR